MTFNNNAIVGFFVLNPALGGSFQQALMLYVSLSDGYVQT